MSKGNDDGFEASWVEPPDRLQQHPLCPARIESSDDVADAHSARVWHASWFSSLAARHGGAQPESERSYTRTSQQRCRTSGDRR